MKAIILAAGYATRLYPLTKNKPKPLLDVGEKSIVELILDKVEKVEQIDEVFLVTNARFYSHFDEWVKKYSFSKPIKVINDGTTNNESRLGAIADLQLVIEQEKLDQDVMVLAGDNLFQFELVDFVHFYNKVGRDCITAHEIHELIQLQQTGVLEMDERQRVISFEEKPQKPKSNLAVPPLYIYQKETLPLVKQYLEEGNNPDAPGHFLPWLIQHKEVRAFTFEGECYDVGTLESYAVVKKVFDQEREKN